MSANVTEIVASSRWLNRSGVIVFGIAIILFLLYPTYAEIFHFWWTYSAYNHCILIIPIAVFLIYEKRAELLSTPPSTSWWGASYVFFNAAVWALGGFLSIAAIQHAAAGGIIIGLIWALLGNARARVIAFPLFYLYFGVPEGEILVPYLRDLTADVVVHLLRMTGIPVFMEGRYLTIPSGQFHVAKACSGINYLIATLAVGTVFAYTRYVSNWRRAAFMVLAIAVPLVANGLRAYGIVMIAHLSNYKYAIGIDHYIYGWVFFGIVIFILFAVGNTFSDKPFEPPDRRTIRWADAEPAANKSLFTILAFILLSVAAAKALYLKATISPEVHDSYAIKLSGSWHILDDNKLDLFGSYAGDPIRLQGEFVSEADKALPVGLEMVLYLDPDKHGELENRANLFFDEEQWQRLSGPTFTDTSVEEIPQAQEYILRRYGQKHLVWIWYDINNRMLINRADVKQALVKARLTGAYRGGAQTVVIVPIIDSDAQARDVLARFLSTLKPTMVNFRLPRADGS